MYRKTIVSLSSALLFVLASVPVSASVHFSASDLLGMTIDAGKSIGYAAGNGSGILTVSPAYEDGVTPMSGLAGAIGNLNNTLFPGATAFYSLAPADLIAFNVAISSGTETLKMVGHNDNNQGWSVGIWYETLLGGITTDFVALAPSGGTGALSLAMPSTVIAAGVAVSSSLTQPDDYHASWSIPEPATIAVWTGLGAIGLLVYRRRYC